MLRRTSHGLLPEEDALDDLEDDDEADPTLPGDLWFVVRERLASLLPPRQCAK
jgi:hypothetical protein